MTTDPQRAGDVEFDAHRTAWQDWRRAPWGRLRYAVVAEVLRRSLADLVPVDGGPGLRVLDVGGGDGGDAVPLALAGHRVTVLDPAPALLEDARAAASAAGATLVTSNGGLDDLPGRLADLGGPFDAVLCHFVVQYRPDVAGTVAPLAAAVRPGGLLSLAAPNPASEVLLAVVRRGAPADALAALHRTSVRTQTFATEVRLVDPDEVAESLCANGFAEPSRYGLRCVSDYWPDDERKHDPQVYADLERLELALCDREPFLRTARMWQLVARRETAER